MQNSNFFLVCFVQIGNFQGLLHTCFTLNFRAKIGASLGVYLDFEKNSPIYFCHPVCMIR